MVKVALVLITMIFLIQINVSLPSNENPKLESSDRIQWIPVSDCNQVYKNWSTYTRIISGISPIDVSIKNVHGNSFTYAWKMDKEAMYRDFSFYLNNISQTSCGNINWASVGPYTIGSGDNLKLKLCNRIGYEGQFWIAFPPSNFVLYPNCTVITDDRVFEGVNGGLEMPNYGGIKVLKPINTCLFFS